MNEYAGTLHYFTFNHTASIINTLFTKKLFKNGELTNTINVNVAEKPPASGYYCATFTDDGSHKATWTLVVYETGSPATKFTQHYFLEQPITEQITKHIRNEVLG